MPLLSLLDAAVCAKTRGRLASFHPEVVRRWGTLSAGGILCHLAGAYEMAAGDAAAAPRTGLFQRTVVRYGALYLPARWPQGVPTLPELVEGAPLVRPGDFADDRARLLTAFDRFANAKHLAGRAHPIFGPLTHWEWMRWGYLHADHHLRQFGL